ncbi:bifunctional UDP-N-acetylmuramoyl-tripeptide:D-alanyl-D-alanine ligase/alanine racemase [Bergeyella sp. RCAD1439]|uniref:bifunctional UDP-N-acetylmuramoyl-tripeptide:D-alanyl-D-alanine ligase/alanine racemase n=1 Tax=Bergeyella anatis TaxID=3113737 RepID=UPI002E1826E1|nr:bifunctional UDP-N-acetylmuramoyl-tripeptide:D-alanyl-D-alanine ligase/alanine racemase [Bergeyella sp. RCAD1439]
MNYTANQLASITGATLVGNGELHVKSIAFDSRNLYAPNETAFIAINTSKNSGEKYIDAAIDKGVKTIISENQTNTNPEITWLLTENSIAFLQKLARYHLAQFPNLLSIGITGSNGKTILKEWLYQSLSDEYKTVKSPKSFNSQLGLPLSVLQTAEKHQIGIFEAGISQPGEMQKLYSVLQPRIGILTHIGSAHLAHFKDEEHLIDEKLKLFASSEIIIFNGDNPLVAKKIKKIYSDRTLCSYGFAPHNDLFIGPNWKNRSEPIQVFSSSSEHFSFPAQQRDEATLSNALCLSAVLKTMGFSNEKIVSKLNALKAVEMRLESVNGVRGNLIINDSFNLDLDSLSIALQCVGEYNKPKKTLLLTDIVEGKNKKELYNEVVRLINAKQFDKILLIGKEIAEFQPFLNTETHTFDTTEQLIESKILNSIENSLVLIKGARKFETEKITYELELQKHDTVLEVNLNAILHNLKVHKSFLNPQTKMMAMVKAYSYGLGGHEIAEFLQHHHIDYLGVAYADEGVDLRRNGITTPIIVMNPEQHSYGTIIDYNLEPEIYSFRVLKQFHSVLKSKGYEGHYPVHIKLETGMHRLGFKTLELEELVHQLKSSELKVASIFSHLSSSDLPDEKNYNLQQFDVFKKNTDFLIRELGYAPLRHILNSAGIVNYSDYQFDMVRIGIGMVGISPDPETQRQLQSAVVFKTVISQISEIKKGDSIGYSRRYKAEKDTRIATIPVGYADGIPRRIGNEKGYVGLHGHLVPIVGNVCMDMLMVDIGDRQAHEGDEVILFNGNPSLETFASYCETIPYEVLTSISRRVKRVYVKN